MHIGLFSPALPSIGSPNGIVTYVRAMKAALVDLGHRVTVISHQSVEHSNGEIRQYQSSWSIRKIISNFASRTGRSRGVPLGYNAEINHLVRRVHRTDPFDVFEMEESFGWVGGLDLNVPVVARLHGPHFLGKNEIEPYDVARASIGRIAAEGKAIASVAGVTSPSASLMAATFAHYGIAPKNAATIQNPMATGQCWSIDQCDPNQLLFVGRFDLRKGADIALAAFVFLAERNPNLRLVMCGPDSGILGLAGELIHFTEYLCAYVPPTIHDRIRFLGAVSADEIHSLRLKSVLCLSTSRFETFSYTMAEALAVGIPLLASDTFGITELICPRKNGFLAPIGNASAVAEAIEYALADRAALAAVGSAGRVLCTTKLDPSKIAKETVAFYQSLF